jgi:hypothetical protein
VKWKNICLRPSSPALWGGLLLGALVLLGCFYNLASYPTIWWDEAIFSETAANLVQHGRYAFTEQSPDKLSDLDFRISAGPAVILPVALAYKLFGVGVESGRLMAGAYLIFTFAALFLATRRLFGAAAGMLAVALAFLGTDVLYWGRSVLGDIPALGLFLFGSWFLLRALDAGETLPLFWGGLFLGLAFDAKEFYGLAFLPPVVLLVRQHWRTWRRLILPLLAFGLGVSLPIVAYVVFKAVILGSLAGAILHFLQQKKLLCHEFFTPLTIGRVYQESFTHLLSHPLFWMGILGTVWVWKKESCSPGERLWVWNLILWSLVYLTSVYWYRFALPALFLASPLAAHFLLKGLARLAPQGARLPAWLTPGMLAAFFILCYPAVGLEIMGQVLTRQGEADAPYRLVKYLRDHVPPGCLIETPEYELAFLDDDLRIHLMPSYFFVESTPQGVVLLNPRQQAYDFDRVGADFLILGSFGKSVFRQVYPENLVTRGWRRIAQVGYYDIYISRKCGRKVLDFIERKVAFRRPATLIRPATKIDATAPVFNTYHH